MQRYLSLTLACLLLLTACRTPESLSGTWQLQSYGALTDPTIAQSKTTINFNNGTASGNAGCNTFSGQYRISGNRLSFSNLASTLMACLDADVMEQEAAVMQGLSDSGQFSVEGNQLTIYYSQGRQALVFRRIP